MKKKLLFIFGTRPEAIKMAPIILEALKFPEHLSVSVCLTGQHKEMLYQVIDHFGIKADYDLEVMEPDQTLFSITSKILEKIAPVLGEVNPDLVLVQGDTTTAFVGAMAAYYKKIKVGHVEAGLRSGDIYSPFPEEVNRRWVSVVTHFHFAPTDKAIASLHAENIRNNVFKTGNTVIDALHLALEKVRDSEELDQRFSFLTAGRRYVLVTGHRRESFGEPFHHICEAIKMVADKYDDVEFVYPVHLNPNVMRPVHDILGGHQRIHLVEPLDYPGLIYMMDKSYLVLTDSGGIQEEAPALGKPVLVMREVTERMEGIEAGTARLVGTSRGNIVEGLEQLLTDPGLYKQMANAVNPYGDGTSARQIIKIIKERL